MVSPLSRELREEGRDSIRGTDMTHSTTGWNPFSENYLQHHTEMFFVC